MYHYYSRVATTSSSQLLDLLLVVYSVDSASSPFFPFPDSFTAAMAKQAFVAK